MSIIIAKGIHHPLFSELSAIVGPNYCADDDFARICYSRDSSPAPARVQGIVVRPGNIEQVVDIVKLANYTRTPIVPSGGRASLYGAPPGLVGKGIVVDMTRMRKVLAIDEVNKFVTAEAGCTVAEMTALVNQKGWDVHTAMQPYFSDTVGGQLSGVLGGGTGMEMTSAEWNGRHINGVKVVLPTGDVIQTGASPGTNINQKYPFAREPGGPDMTGMFIGDAGVFGIKVEASYRIYRISKCRDGRATWFKTLDEAWDFAAELSQVEPEPCTAIFVIPPTALTVGMGGRDEYLGIGLVKGNSEEDLAPRLATIEEIARRHGGDVANDAVAKGWIEDATIGARHREMGSFASLGVWTYLELIPPPSEVKDCILWIREFHQGYLNKLGIPFNANNGCVGVGGNQWIITSIIFLKGYDDRAMEVMNDLWRRGIAEGAARGWVTDANQGWGSVCMAKYWTSTFSAYMRSIKNALDPNHIMNPGLFGL